MNNDKKKQELFVKYLKNKYGEKNLTDEKIKELKDSGQLQKDYQDFEKALAKKAAHGTKLTYFRTLKNQCAEDEELYYYKKGGSVGCGCKKKEDGGEVQTEKDCGGGAVAKFKAMKMQKAGKVRTKAEQDKINKQSEEDYFAGTADHTKPGVSKPTINKPKNRREEPEQPKVTKPKPVTNIKKDSSKNVKTTIQKCGGEVVKKFKAKCGSKIKKHQKGTEKGGIEYKPNWYKSISRRNIRVSNNGLPSDELSKISINGDEFTRNIYPAIINDGEVKYDTFYTYKPKNHPAEVESSINPSQKYRNLKEAFNRIASIPTYYYSQYGK